MTPNAQTCLFLHLNRLERPDGALLDAARFFQMDLYHLIEEQAAVHAHTTSAEEGIERSHHLFNAIRCDGSCQAVIALDERTRFANAVATFYTGENSTGPFTYVEDIVTTRRSRRHGIGSELLGFLAYHTTNNGYGSAVWECLSSNSIAGHFYDHHQVARIRDQTTWRAETVPTPRSPVSDSRTSYRVVAPSNTRELLAFLHSQNVDDIDRRVQWLTMRPENPASLFLIAQQGLTTVGFASAYRNYSTFRQVEGLHIGEVITRDNNTGIAQGLIDHLVLMQACHGWTGHTDITLSSDQTSWLRPVLDNNGFVPLAYGGDTTTLRCLSGQPLQTLSETFARRHLAPEPNRVISQMRLRAQIAGREVAP